MIERFAGYGFNKAHSAAYAVIAAQTAYMKANHPVEFMAALLSTEIGNTDKIVFNAVECKKSSIEVLPPDINRSDWEFEVEETSPGTFAVRFGLGAVKNAGEGAIRSIVAARRALPNQTFSDLDHFCDAIDWKVINRRAVESLAKCGALDCLGTRSAILTRLEPAIVAAQARQKASAKGQIGMFDIVGSGSAMLTAPTTQPVDAPAIPSSQLLAWEKELLGVYLSDHPLSEIIGSGQIRGNTLIVELPDRTPGSKVKIVGMVAGIRRITTRTNRTMAIVDLEDLTGNIELVMFPDCYDQHGEVLESGAILEVTAKLELRNEQLQLVCESATDQLTMAEAKPTSSRTVHVRLRTTGNYWDDVGIMNDVIAILRRHEGDDDVHVYLPVAGDWVVFRSRSYRVDWNDVLAAELKRQLGSEHVRFEERRLAS